MKYKLHCDSFQNFVMRIYYHILCGFTGNTRNFSLHTDMSKDCHTLHAWGRNGLIVMMITFVSGSGYYVCGTNSRQATSMECQYHVQKRPCEFAIFACYVQWFIMLKVTFELLVLPTQVKLLLEKLIAVFTWPHSVVGHSTLTQCNWKRNVFLGWICRDYVWFSLNSRKASHPASSNTP